MNQGLNRSAAYLLSILLLCLASAGAAAAAGFPLTMEVIGSGTVTRNPNLDSYPEGAVVSVTAHPAAGWYLGGWSGDGDGVTNPLSVSIVSARHITATFLPIPVYAVQVNGNGEGTVSLQPPGGSYLSNTTVTVTAEPRAGWVFNGWTGGLATVDNPAALVVRGSNFVTATFVELPAVVSSPQSVVANPGSSVSLAVVAVGSGPLAYQWWFAGTPLNGATNATLILAGIQGDQQGAYHAVVSNPWGSANSAVASVVVADNCSGTNSVGACDEASLRMAMAAGGLVRICCNGTIILTETIEIGRDVAIDARGRNLVISGNHAVRLFTVRPGVTFVATNVTLAAGRHQGADGTNWTGIPGLGNPAPLPDPGKPGEGGAILNEGGHVLLVSSRLSGNEAVGGRGGMSAASLLGMGGAGKGGAVVNRGGTVRLLAVTATNNVASGGLGAVGSLPSHGPSGPGLGAVIYSDGGVIEVDDSFLLNNRAVASAAARGGALFLDSGSATLRRSRLHSNQAAGESSQSSSASPGSAYGGAVAVATGTMTLERCELRWNRAAGGMGYRNSGSGEAQGGAAFSSGVLRAVDTVLAENAAVAGGLANPSADASGGAIYSVGALTLTGCAVVNNRARGGDGANISNGAFPARHALGGGLYLRGEAAMTNTTVALNVARGGDGAFPNGAPGNSLGGGIFQEAASVVGVSLTLASNLVGNPSYWPSTPSPAQVAGANVGVTNASVALLNTLLAGGGVGENVFGPLTDLGFNLSSDGSAQFASGTSFNEADARLGPLGNYGGFTPTLALRPNSPAIDFGAASGVPLFDQRGMARPFGDRVDIGAYEFRANQTEVPRLSIAPGNGAVQMTFEARAGSSYEVQARSESPDWVVLETMGPFSETAVVQRSFPTAGQVYRFYRLEMK